MAAPYTPPDATIAACNLKLSQNIYFDWVWWTVTQVDVSFPEVKLQLRSMLDEQRFAEVSLKAHSEVYTEKEI